MQNRSTFETFLSQSRNPLPARFSSFACKIGFNNFEVLARFFCSLKFIASLHLGTRRARALKRSHHLSRDGNNLDQHLPPLAANCRNFALYLLEYTRGRRGAAQTLYSSPTEKIHLESCVCCRRECFASRRRHLAPPLPLPSPPHE